MSGGGTNTVTQQSSPPSQYLDAFSNATQAAQNVSSTPYQAYPYELVAPFSPDQANSFGQVEGLTANGGVQQPYLQSAQTDITNAATGINPQNFGSTVSAYESPFTQQVLGATEASEANTDAQQQQQVSSQAAQSGAYGGDREAVAHAITAGQQALANNQTNAGIEQAGFNQATSTAEANQWLNSQAGAGEANLGSEAQSTGLQGASALLQTGGLEQQMGQEQLNVPYEQYLAAQAYPFQTTGWLANIEEGLGGASGGTSSTTSPAASSLSQVAGLGIGGLGLYNAANNAGLFGGGATGDASSAALAAEQAAAAGYTGASSAAISAGANDGLGLIYNRGGMIPRFAPGGGMGDPLASSGMSPAATNNPLSATGPAPAPDVGISTPDVALSVVPGSSGMGDAAASGASREMSAIKNPQGSTSVTTGAPSEIGSLIQDAGQIAASIYGGPIAGAAAGALSQAFPLKRGGMIPIRWSGGMVPRHFADGGSPLDPMRPAGIPQVGGNGLSGVPAAGFSVPAPQQSAHGRSMPQAPHAVPQQSIGSEMQPLIQEAKDLRGYDDGGSVNVPNSWYAPIMQENLDNQMMNMLGLGAATTAAAPAPDPSTDQTGMARGGMTPRQHFDIGGMSMGTADPSWARTEERQATDRHGLLASPIAGRTDEMAISPASGSYVVPADVVSGLGEGNTLAGANVVQKMLETGPHGLQMPHERLGKGPPRPPPAYREGMFDDGMAGGGGIGHFDEGGDVGDLVGIPEDDDEDAAPIGGGMGPPASGGMQPVAMGPEGPGNTTSADAPGKPQDWKFHTAKADPWLALAEAGFSMAAGKSPHALENIGAGAEKGVQSYVQQQQVANQRDLQAQELQARLADTKAYRESLAGIRQQHENNYGDLAQAHIAEYQAQADKLSAAAANGNGEKFSFVGVSPDTGMPIFAGNRGTMKQGDMAVGMKPADQARADQGSQHVAQGWAGVAQRQKAQDALEAYRTSSEADRVAARAAALQAGNTLADIKMIDAGGRDIATGKPNLTPQQAHEQRAGLSEQNAPGPTAAAAPPVPNAKQGADGNWYVPTPGGGWGRLTPAGP